LDGLVVRRGPLPLPLRAHGHALAVTGVAPEPRLDAAGRGVGDAPDEGEVTAADRPPGELRRERGVRRVVLRHDDEAGGVLVEAVDEAGSHGGVALEAGASGGRREAEVLVVPTLVVPEVLRRDGPGADVVEE